VADYDAIDPWHLGAYVEAIRPSIYEWVVESCVVQDGKLMVCNPNPHHSCPPVYICMEAIRLHVDQNYAGIQASDLKRYASLPVGQWREVRPDVVARFAKWGLEVIQRDRWLMNSSEVTFDSIVHFLDLCRPVWQG
jgi:hypothetical protein